MIFRGIFVYTYILIYNYKCCMNSSYIELQSLPSVERNWKKSLVAAS